MPVGGAREQANHATKDADELLRAAKSQQRKSRDAPDQARKNRESAIQRGGVGGIIDLSAATERVPRRRFVMSRYTGDPLSGGGMRMARTRGLASGVLLLVLGAWAAIVPFIGDYIDFAYTPTSTWTWTSGRGWYEVAPGAAAFLGGLLLLFSAYRAVTSLGAWLGIAGGAWLIIGPQLATFLDVGSTGTPTGTSNGVIALERLFYFYAIGAAILLVAAVAG